MIAAMKYWEDRTPDGLQSIDLNPGVVSVSITDDGQVFFWGETDVGKALPKAEAIEALREAIAWIEANAS